MKCFSPVRRCFPLFAALLPLALAGCGTLYGDSRATEAGKREDALRQQENFDRLKGRIEGLELEVGRLRSDVDQLRADQANAAQAAVQQAQNSLAALDAKIRAVDAAREKDKQEIVDQLTGKISQIVATSSGSAKGKSAVTTSKHKVSDEGYEHVVQPGETLSAIAAAYNVRSTDIITANDIDNPDRLHVGQKLFIPAP